MFDYQKVSLVAITQPRVKHETEQDPSQWEGYGIKRNLTPDEFIAYCARVSNPGNQNNTGTAQKLVNYLIRNEHWSPFEMVSVTLEIKTTRDIGRQILRHRSFSFQEFSQRYAVLDPEDMIASRQARLQDVKNRQNSITVEDLKLQEDFIEAQHDLWAVNRYRQFINRGVAKECARVLLPEGLTMSTMYMAGTLRSWLHYCALRCANGTQKEHQDIALKARDILIKEFPSCEEYLLNVNSDAAY